MNLVFHSVTQDNWSDLEGFIECKGSPHYCWCTAWRKITKKNPTKQDKKAVLKKSVEAETPIGILAYFEDEPIAWCSIAPRETYKTLGGDESKENVWSLVCFFIKRPYRNRGLTAELIQQAIKYAHKNGAKYVEAYPVDTEPESPSYRFMGYKQTFERANFKFIKKAGKRRNVMLLEVKD